MSEDKVEYGLTTTATSLPAPIASPKEWATRRQQFNDFVNTQLRDKVDYGIVPGTDKKTLLKPGAEKILQMYGLAVTLDITERQQDANTGYLYIECIAKGVNITTGALVGYGVGACSSYESKYRWRWEYWKKSGMPPADEGWETFWDKYAKANKLRRRLENRDLIDTWNTVLKMGKKRALVDLALTISGASEKFTQDVEDFVETEAYAHQDTEDEKQGTKGEKPSVNNGKADDFAIPDWFKPSDESLAAARAVVIKFGVHKDETLGSVEDDKKEYIAWLTSDAFDPKTDNAKNVKRAAIYLRAYRKAAEMAHRLPPDDDDEPEQPPMEEAA